MKKNKLLKIKIIITLFLYLTPYLVTAQEGKSNDFSYQVGAGDVLTIKVFDNPDLSGNFKVSAEGNIVYPLLGQIKVLNQDIISIKKVLTQMLAKDYLYNPIVSLNVFQFRSKQVKILGNVGKPGIYYLERPTRIFDLLSMAQGISNQLGNVMRGQKVRIVRQIGAAKLETIYIDLYKLLVEGKEEVNLQLKNGDIIYIPENQKVHIVGGVRSPGTFPYEEGLTVLKAISVAGGVHEKVSVEDIFIRRIENGKEVEVKVGMSDILQPEDIVEISTKIKQVHVIGEVGRPGSFNYEEGMTILMAITLAGGPNKKTSIKNVVIKRIVEDEEIKEKVTMSTVLKPSDIVEVPLSFW